jgi:DNA-cytosine methyltransferase
MRFIDLFCGIGGFHTGITHVLPDAECVLACDLSPKSRKKYTELYDITPCMDVCQITEVPPADVICGGFPCQPFSSIGAQRGLDDPRGNLFFEILRIASLMSPKPVLLLENVAYLLKGWQGQILQTFLTAFDKAGYDVSYSLLSPHHFGVPQHRPRVFFVAVPKERGVMFDFTPLQQQQTITKFLKDILDDPPNPPIKKAYTLFDTPVGRNPKSGLSFYGYINAPPRIANAERRGTHSKPTHQAYHSDDNRIFDSGGVAPTKTTRNSINVLHGGKVSTLSLPELHRVCGFPETMNLTKHQMGNAVCPVVVEAVVKEMVRQGIIS